MAGISGSVELLSQSFASEDDRKLGKIILKEIDRLNRLISEFLDFAKPEKPPVDKVLLAPLIKETVESAKSNFAKPVEITINIPEGTAVLGSRDKLKQALLNIVINSFQAMEQTAAAKIEVNAELEGERVLLKIRDNGSGIKPETQKRMFEAFHTTKPKGTGLGLAITHKILEAHGALIFVESQVGLGTLFVISFPRKSFEIQ